MAAQSEHIFPSPGDNPMDANALALKARIKELGLPETASWDDVVKHNDRAALKATIKELGLPETASWADVVQKRRNQELTK